MTDEQYTKAYQIKNLLIGLQQAIKFMDDVVQVEIHCKDLSNRYYRNSNKYTELEIFKIMQESIIKGLQDKIAELEEEYKSL